MSTTNEKPNEPEPIRGRMEPAAYRVPEEFKQSVGNPLIEALPAPSDWEKPGPGVMEALTQYFDIDKKVLKTASALTRLFQLAEFKTQYFQPLQRHRDLEQTLSLSIRFGYLSRNPMDPRHRRNIHDKIAEFKRPAPKFIAAANLGFVLLGSPGLGKTTSVGRILQLYPQVILHNNEKLTNMNQVVWLFLTCPHDKSTKALCLLFFKEVDAVLGTNYLKEYSSDTEGGMMAGMAVVAAIISLGVLVIDEIQFVSAAKSGGKEDLLKFIVQMQNTLGIPIVLVGTHKADDLVAGGPHQSRRSVGMGGRSWNRLTEDDPEWQLFLSSMWQHQYLKDFVELTPGLATKMFFESQGILTYAVDLFFFAQLNAINDGTETITEDSIQWAAQENMLYNRPYIRALQSKDADLAAVLEDIVSKDYENPREFFAERLNLPPKPTPTKTPSTKPCVPPATSQTATETEAGKAGPSIPGFHPAGVALPVTETPPKTTRRRRRKMSPYPAGSIMAICEEAHYQEDLAPYEALMNSDIIRSAGEFMPATNSLSGFQ